MRLPLKGTAAFAAGLPLLAASLMEHALFTGSEQNSGLRLLGVRKPLLFLLDHQGHRSGEGQEGKAG